MKKFKPVLCASCGYERKLHFTGGKAFATFPLPCEKFVEDDGIVVEFDSDPYEIAGQIQSIIFGLADPLSW